MSSSEKSLQVLRTSKDASGVLKKQQGSRLSEAERTTIRTLAQQRVPVTQIAAQLGRTRQTVSSYLADLARATLETNAGRYADIHLEAAVNAAAKGDSRPAEWALERLRVVEPASKTPENKGLTINIGVAIPGLGDSASLSVSAGECSQVIDSEVDSE